jgi:hypothetical protein
VRVEAHPERLVHGEKPTEVPVGGAAEVHPALNRLHRARERLHLRPGVRREILEVELDPPRVLVRGDQRECLGQQQWVRAILESRAGRFRGERFAHETACVGHAIEAIVVKNEEFAIPQELDVDLPSKDVLAGALLDGERRILGVEAAPEATVDHQLDDAAVGLEERVRVREGGHLRDAPPIRGSSGRPRHRSSTQTACTNPAPAGTSNVPSHPEPRPRYANR